LLGPLLELHRIFITCGVQKGKSRKGMVIREIR
jgi:hypothetical protein